MRNCRQKLLASAGVLVLTLGACLGDLLNPEAHYDSRRVTLQFLSLYNQRFRPKSGQRGWQGDWVFRRERLSLIDQELRAVKPDLIILQEMMGKKGSPYDSDLSILSAGALAGYDWQVADGNEYEDTNEVESMALVTGLPLRQMSSGGDNVGMWPLGSEGLLGVFSADMEGQPLSVFNVKLPSKEAKQGIWYRFIEDRIAVYLEAQGRCSKRLVVGGFFGGELEQPEYQAFLEALQLVDVSQGFCEKESLCYTATPLNELYKAIQGDQRPQRQDRLLVHQSALVYSSMRNFYEAKADNEYGKVLGLNTLWATPRLGWVAGVRFARCHEKSMMSF